MDLGLLQQLLRALTGQENNQLAIITSTLAIYALSQPLRRRIQAPIDRRFCRRRYDASRILAAFSANLRDKVELDSLTTNLAAVIEETLQPRHVSLWLRESRQKAQVRQAEEHRSPALR